MQLVEATERWVDDRLCLVAGALHLPCPVRESFLFDADYAFYAQCTDSDTTLQRAGKRIFLHAGLPCDAVVVLWRASGLDHGAKVERDGDSWFIELDPIYKTNSSALGAILARAVARALITQREITRAGTAVDEVDVDLGVILIGLGALLLTHDISYGALRPRLVRFVYARLAASLGVGLWRALGAGQFGTAMKAQLVVLWPRVQRAALPFGPLESHVIIRCFCGRRLRVPTGARGTTTCPACKRKRPFDGRACRVVTRPGARTLHTQVVPVLTAWQRFGISIAELPLMVRLLVVTGLAATALIAVVVMIR